MIGILGAGLAGLSSAYHLNPREYVILEKDREVGGLCKSFLNQGYTFDYAPHIFFTRDEYIKSLIHKLLGENIETKIRKAFIYIYGEYIEYPFEAHLAGLPKDVIDECISSASEAQENARGYKNFYEWIENVLGKGVAKHYMVPYNEKIWKYDLRKMHFDWIAGRVPAPNIDEMKRGAAGSQEKAFGPNAMFSYPIKGGIGAIPNSFLPYIKNLNLRSEVIHIKPIEKKVVVSIRKDGKEKEYNFDKIFSSIPLPELLKIIEDVPDDIIKTSEKLVYNSLLFAAIGVDRPNITDKHWLYFPEKDYVFHRLSFPMNLSEKTTPPNKSSIMIEVTYPMKNQIDIEKTRDLIFTGLVKANLLTDKDKIEVFYTERMKYAYVIYDLNHKKNVSKLHDFLIARNIIPIGRFAQWEYINMDKTILNAKLQVKKFR
ncbi:MAG: protoporphyrinogen/coproporphyrinogen oxidase [Candidatus Helarchaeota archaeon]